MKLQEIIDVWDELHVKDTGELGFCDLANAVEKVVGITNKEGVKVRDLQSPYSPVSPEIWLAECIMELRDQQPNP